MHCIASILQGVLSFCVCVCVSKGACGWAMHSVELLFVQRCLLDELYGGNVVFYVNADRLCTICVACSCTNSSKVNACHKESVTVHA